MVTDYATFGWMCDVFILPSHRGRGLGKWLVECMVAHPDIKGLRRILLSSRDVQDLYEKYGGFHSLHYPVNWMEKFTETPFRKGEPSAPTEENKTTG